MARKLFISFLGTTPYRQCTYTCQDNNWKSSPTCFIQQAALEQIEAKTWNKQDKVCIFLTKGENGSHQLNWDKDIDSRETRNGEKVPYKGLEQVLIDMHLPCSVEGIDLRDENDVWKVFDDVDKVIEKDDDLYIDLTHAFRYLPMLILVLSNYSKVLKGTHVRYLSYGNFEGSRQPGTAPIVDLLPLSLLQGWTLATSDFLNFGHPENLEDMIQTVKDTRRYKSDDIDRIDNLVNDLSTFTSERHLCKGSEIENGVNLNNIINGQREFKNEETDITPLIHLFELIKGSVQQRNTHVERVLDAVDWCYKKKLYQQAATLLQEGIVSYFCRRHGLKEEDILNNNKREIVNKAFFIRKQNTPRNKWIVDDKYLPFLEELVNDHLIAELATPFDELKSLRNAFNHAGFQNEKSNVDEDQIPVWCTLFRGKLLGEKDHLVTSKQRPRILLNLSNHPSEGWSKEQVLAGEAFGEIVDMHFPNIAGDLSIKGVKKKARKTAESILKTYSDADLTVHVMGEMTFTYHLVSLLKGCGIRCLASCTEREVEDLGNGRRITQFHFSQFREY